MDAGYNKNGRFNRRIQQSEIAERAGVSISTVSRVLNNKTEGFISDKMKQRVLLAIQNLNQDALFSEGPANLQNIGLFVGNKFVNDLSGDPFHARILQGIEAECRNSELNLSYTVLPPGQESADFILHKVQQNNIDGVILLAVDDKKLVETVWSRHIPLVLVNSHPQGFPIDNYLPDNWLGAKLAVEHLIQNGHKNIVHVTDLTRWTIRTRHAAYRHALEEAGLSYNPALVLQNSIVAESAYKSMIKFLAEKPPEFTAIFCASDNAATGVARALREKGLQIPHDVSLVGFDDAPIAPFLEPPLTTVRVEGEEMGRRAVRGLLERATYPNQSSIKVEFACRLIERSSVLNINRN